MRSRPYYDELQTFRGETERGRHHRNEGSICAVAERRYRHDMEGRSVRWLSAVTDTT